MKKIYIVLTKTNTVLSRIISVIKNDDYTHSSISLNKDLDNMYSFGRKNRYNPFVGCFVTENLDKGVFGWHKNLKGMVLEIEVTNEQYERAEKLINEFILNSNKYKYSYIGLIDSLFNKEKHYNDRFLCSEFVYYILSKIEAADLQKSRNLIRPQDFLKIESKILFEGNLKKSIWSKNTNHTFNIIPKYQSI